MIWNGSESQLTVLIGIYIVFLSSDTSFITLGQGGHENLPEYDMNGWISLSGGIFATHYNLTFDVSPDELSAQLNFSLE